MKVSIIVDNNNKVQQLFYNDDEELQGNIHLNIDDNFLEENNGKPLKYINNEIVVDSVQEQINNLEQEITEAKEYLKETDYIVIKINEYKLQDIPVDSLLIQYSSELAEREAKRELINTLEQEIKDLKIS